MSFKQSIAALIVLFSVSFSAYADKIVYVHTKAYGVNVSHVKLTPIKKGASPF